MEQIITEIVGLVLKGSTMELGKRFTEGAIAKIKTLRQLIITRLQGKPKAKEAIAQLEAGSEEALTSDQLPVTSDQLPVTSYQLPVTSYQLPVTSYQLPVTSYQLPGVWWEPQTQG